MALIDAYGIYEGDRISACSPEAQLYYLRLLIGANGFGRFRVDYKAIVATAFVKWPKDKIPTEHELMGYLAEYRQNRLLFLYRAGGEIWGQWDSPKGTFGKYQNRTDHRSPVPPKEEFDAWIDENRRQSKKSTVVADLPATTADLFPEVAPKFSNLAANLEQGLEISPQHVRVGVGEGVTCMEKVLVLEGEKQQTAPSGPEPLTDPSATAHHALTVINTHGVILPVGPNMRVARDAADSCHKQGMPFTEIAELMIRGAPLYAASHSPPNWYSYFANTAFLHPEKLERNGNGNGASKSADIKNNITAALEARAKRRVAGEEAGFAASAISRAGS